MTGIPKRKRSGGPKTEAGKMIASSNSFKAGAFSGLVVLPNESKEDFQKLCHEFCLSLSPKGIVEEAIVQDLVSITWRKMRLEGLQRAGEERALTKPLKAADLRGEFWVKDEYDWLIRDISVLTEDFYQESIANLQFINRLSDRDISKDEFSQLPNTHPTLYNQIKNLVIEEFGDAGDASLTPEHLGKLTKVFYEGSRVPFFDYAVEVISDRMQQIQWVYRHLEEIKEAMRAVREKRLLSMLQEVGLMRARDEMGRAFSKGLAELRKQQQWRLNMAIDVTPPKQD